MTTLIRKVERRVWARCGEVCGTNIFHQVFVYEEGGVKKFAIQCPRCSSMTLLDVPFTEAFHGTS